MPVYEYQCPSCGVAFERQQSITASPIRTCPECGGRKVQRLISSTSFVLKGSGWYVTDYARKGKGTEPAAGESKSGGESKPGGEKSEKSATESKPAKTESSSTSSTSTVKSSAA